MTVVLSWSRVCAGVLIAVFLPVTAIAMGAARGKASQPSSSLSDSLDRSYQEQLHILYVHGMSSDGPRDFDSWGLRKSICEHLGNCNSLAGELDTREYADEGVFALDAPPPGLAYLGHPVWDKNTPAEWNASAPYVDHWNLTRKSGPTVYVDEINWWPLVFALKCRQIVESDARLVGPNTKRLNLCAKSEVDKAAPGRFVSYAWIQPEDVQRLNRMPLRGALVNRALKNSILDWGFSDAMIAVGPLRPYLLAGIRQLVLKSTRVTLNGSRGGPVALSPEQEFVIVSHSLGSYLIFSALDVQAARLNPPALEQNQGTFTDILSHTSMVYFFANQLRLLELADLDITLSGDMTAHLENWGRLRTAYLLSAGTKLKDAAPPQIIAWNDPSDLLTWEVPTLSSVCVHNRNVKNATHWFWLFESPTKAHDRYAHNPRVTREMFKPTQANDGCGKSADF